MKESFQWYSFFCRLFFLSFSPPLLPHPSLFIIPILFIFSYLHTGLPTFFLFFLFSLLFVLFVSFFRPYTYPPVHQIFLTSYVPSLLPADLTLLAYIPITLPFFHPASLRFFFIIILWIIGWRTASLLLPHINGFLVSLSDLVRGFCDVKVIDLLWTERETLIASAVQQRQQRRH